MVILPLVQLGINLILNDLLCTLAEMHTVETCCAILT